MTVDVITAGQSRAYSATARGMAYVISNNTGQFARITNLIVDGKAATEPGIGPNPERRTIGPLSIGDAFTITADIGQVLVEYDSFGSPDVAPRNISGAYVLSSSDDRAILQASVGTTVTVPENLGLIYGAIVRCPSSGTINIAPGTSNVFLNGTSVTVGRTRATSPNGFAITPNVEANSWGVSNGVVVPTLPSFSNLTGVPADNAALTAALALKADLTLLPVTLLRTIGPRNGVASGTAQIFFIGSSNPSQAVIPAGSLGNVGQRVSVRFFVTKNGTTDPLAVNLYLGTNGTSADTQIGASGSLPIAIRQGSGEFVVQRIDATHVSCQLRMEGISTTAFAGTTFTVPTLAADSVLSLAIKTGSTDIPTLVSCEMELK